VARPSFLANWRDALRDSELSTRAKVVGFVLSTYMNTLGEAFPSKTTLADGTSQSVRTVDAAIAELEAARFLRITKSKGRVSWRYAATIPNPAAVAGLDEVEPGSLDAATWQRTTANVATVADESSRKRKRKPNVFILGENPEGHTVTVPVIGEADAVKDDLAAKGWTNLSIEEAA
jgi:helix-turn-helix protein